MPASPIRVVVYYDFASVLCYVAHRVMARLEPDLDRLGLVLDWTPIDLTRITGWVRGSRLDSARLTHVRAVARTLVGEVRSPAHWIDSRPAATVALALAGTTRAPTWRERIWTAVFEEGRDPGDAAVLAACARDLGLDLQALPAPSRPLDTVTEQARSQGVSGLPTFMLGDWPLPGIQDDATMCALLARYVARRAAGAMR